MKLPKELDEGMRNLITMISPATKSTRDNIIVWGSSFRSSVAASDCIQDASALPPLLDDPPVPRQHRGHHPQCARHQVQQRPRPLHHLHHSQLPHPPPVHSGCHSVSSLLRVLGRQDSQRHHLDVHHHSRQTCLLRGNDLGVPCVWLYDL